LAKPRTSRRLKHPPIERKRFGEITPGNEIVFTIDGEETFELIYDAILHARSSVYIAGYDLDPSLNFVRDSDYTTSRIDINRHSYSSSSKSIKLTSPNIDSKSLEDDRDKPLSVSSPQKSRQNLISSVEDITIKQHLKGTHTHKRFQELIIKKATTHIARR
jgi:hypothetical protein